MIRRLIFGRYTANLHKRLMSTENDLHCSKLHVKELLDLRRELRVRMQKVTSDRLEVQVMFHAAGDLKMEEPSMRAPDPVRHKRVYLERAVASLMCPDTEEAMADATPRLKEMLAQYCGKHVTEKLMEEMR